MDKTYLTNKSLNLTGIFDIKDVHQGSKSLLILQFKCFYFLNLSSNLRLCAIYADDENFFYLLFQLFCVGLLLI